MTYKNQSRPKRATMRQVDIKRYLQGIISAGITPSRVEVEEAKIIVYAGDRSVIEPHAKSLDVWRARNGSDKA